MSDTQPLETLENGTWSSLGCCQEAFRAAMERCNEVHAVQRIWGRDGSLWKSDQTRIAEIEDRLGWLDLPSVMQLDIGRLKALAMECRAKGFQRVVLLGMGGSSMAPEVMFSVLPREGGYPSLAILDTTDPAQIARVAAEGDLARTLFIVASKSGSTAETLSLYTHFRQAVEAAAGANWPRHFLAITDPGSALAKLGAEAQFRNVYLNPPDIGGRYSALSLFGLVPAALVGVDLDDLLARATRMAKACKRANLLAANPGMALGIAMGAAAGMAPPARRDMLTLITSPRLSAFGAWTEQLIAESTGKEGVGILPIEGEPLSLASLEGADRFYVYLRLDGDDNAATDQRVAALAEAGHPVVALGMGDAGDLGAEFYRWEYATAVAGFLLGINPFDQPNVESAKVQARSALSQYEKTQALQEEPFALTEGILSLASTEDDLPTDSAAAYVKTFLGAAAAGDYVALMAYVDRNAAHESALRGLATTVSEALGIPVTVGFGPRFLHSTGQLHKGGRNNGLFVQLTQDDPEDMAIPGKTYTFSVLKRAQALGDRQALASAQRRTLRVHLGSDPQAGLAALEAVLASALSG